MFPLLQKDGLTLAYTAAIIGFHVLIAPRSSGWRYVDNARRLSLLGMVAIHALAALTEPPVSSVLSPPTMETRPPLRDAPLPAITLMLPPPPEVAEPERT